MPAHLSLPLWSHSALIFMANAFNTDHDDDGDDDGVDCDDDDDLIW